MLAGGRDRLLRFTYAHFAVVPGLDVVDATVFYWVLACCVWRSPKDMYDGARTAGRDRMDSVEGGNVRAGNAGCNGGRRKPLGFLPN